MQIELFTVGSLVIAVVAVISTVIAAVRAGHLRQDLERTRRDLDSERGTSAEVMDRLATAYSERTEARTRLNQVEQQVVELMSERDAARTTLAAAEKSRNEAEKDAALAVQARTAMEDRQKDRETTRTEFAQHAQAAMLSTTHKVSSKLIADLKRESEAEKKVSDVRNKNSAENLNRHFEGMVKSLATLDSQVSLSKEQISESEQRVETIWRALSSPAGAGEFSEIGLENTLKSVGLVRDRDFSMQYSINDAAEGRQFRPDAVVFLPRETVLVIDSKASKFLLELADVEGTEKESAALANLAKTMNQHLKALAGKDYKGAIMDSYRASGRAGDIRHVISVMYLPNEGAVEKLNRADPEIVRKSRNEGIVIAGPAGLESIMGLVSANIDLGRQAENQEQIVDSTQQLLESVAVVVDHVGRVGKGIKSAADNFGNLTRSINARLIPRARALTDLGVRPAKGKALPAHLGQYQVVDLSQPGMIEGEAEDVSAGEDAPAALESPKDDGPTGVDADAG